LNQRDGINGLIHRQVNTIHLIRIRAMIFGMFF